MMDSLEDVRHAVRSLSKVPVFTATAILALALGTGSTTAIFCVVNTMLLKPLPYPDPGRIVVLTTSAGGGKNVWVGSPAQFNFLRFHIRTLEDFSAYRYGRVNLTGVEYPQQIQAAYVTADYFRLFGQAVAPGRAFRAEECQPGGPAVVILSPQFWKRDFAADPRVPGSRITLGGKPYEIIGVMASVSEPPSIAAEAREMVDVWMPFPIDRASIDPNSYFSVAARIKPEVSLAAVRAELDPVTSEFRRQFPAAIDPQSVFSARLLREALTVGAGSLSLFEWAVALVLLIACANVAGLLLVRSTGRKREIAIRAAMGAGRGRIVRQLLAESLLLAFAGGALGLPPGIAGIRILLAMNAVSLPRIGDHGAAVTADWRVFLFTALVSAAACLFSGLAPALHASRADLGEALNGSASRITAGLRETRARSLLVSGELALAVVLLTGAALLMRTLAALHSVDPGFDPHHVLTMRLSLADTHPLPSSILAQLVGDSTARIEALPGVEAAASTCCLPLDNNLIGAVEIVGRPSDRAEVVDVTAVSPGYFDVFRIPLKRGRAFSGRDLSGSPPVVLISESMARRFWPGDEAFAGPLRSSLAFPDVPGRSWQIAGIVGDVWSYGLSRGAPAIVYFPLAQAPEELSAYILRNPIAWSIRTRGEPGALRLAIQKELSQAAGGLAVSGVESMQAVLDRSMAGREFQMWLLVAFGGCALFLASLGIYGWMAWSVAERTQEIGVRMALGARAASVRNLMLLRGARIALSGASAGILAASALTRLLAGFLFGVTPGDPVAFLAAPLVLVTVAFAAVWLPAVRAARLDPLAALRHN